MSICGNLAGIHFTKCGAGYTVFLGDLQKSVSHILPTSDILCPMSDRVNRETSLSILCSIGEPCLKSYDGDHVSLL
jgi:hypothetical protein